MSSHSYTYLKLDCDCPSCKARTLSMFCAIIDHNYTNHDLNAILHGAYQDVTIEEWQKSRV